MPVDADVAWLAEHDQELARLYPGQWVAIWHGRVIAAGDDGKKVADQADQIAPPEEYILHVVNADVDVIYASDSVG